ncbi:hypothetical protein IE81DRAFT_188832 [Ceraceosorus guamensis]|uniref:Uncharacterized protein n=1 Tax=Ceraceosorus guamensis TaxID=1522189 RepID=A0A316W648_9BASI|nr:hypothetical protein IE81DRAFT_188832 [Ceraceosorus guamensis]PWN45357.1 hypothetical protein IE81DRAFT_188832 [Ceraceosorus guamensis]
MHACSHDESEVPRKDMTHSALRRRDDAMHARWLLLLLLLACLLVPAFGSVKNVNAPGGRATCSAVCCPFERRRSCFSIKRNAEPLERRLSVRELPSLGS